MLAISTCLKMLSSRVLPNPETIMSTIPACPKCGSEYAYEDGALYICPECAHEWSISAQDAPAETERVIKDANGNIIGGSLTDAVDTHDIWTFFRDVKSGDRNWKLDETDAV